MDRKLGRTCRASECAARTVQFRSRSSVIQQVASRRMRQRLQGSLLRLLHSVQASHSRSLLLLPPPRRPACFLCCCDTSPSCRRKYALSRADTLTRSAIARNGFKCSDDCVQLVPFLTELNEYCVEVSHGDIVISSGTSRAALRTVENIRRNM